MPLFDIEPGDNPRAFGTMSFGVEGQAPAFSVDSSGNMTILGSFNGGTVIGLTVGLLGNYTTLAEALTAIGSTETDLYVISALTFTANVTIPANVRLIVTRAGSISLATFTLTVNGRFAADRRTVFTSAGTVVFGPAAVEYSMPEWWGAVAGAIGTTPSVDSGPAITLAVASVKTNAGVVDLDYGAYKVLTCIDMSLIQTDASFHVNPKSVTLQGKGSRETYLVGGETGYGFIDFVGSNYLHFKGFSTHTVGSSIQYAMVGGRTTGNASSGCHQFDDVELYGTHTEWAYFGLASEIDDYSGLNVCVLGGKGVCLAKDMGGHTITAKYAPLSSTVPYGGGNGVNRIRGPLIQSSSANAADTALQIEFAQTMLIENLYLFSHNLTAPLVIKKNCHDITFVDYHQEFLNTEPHGVYFSAADMAVGDAQFTNISFIGCRMYDIYGEDNTTVTNLTFRGVFRGTAAQTVDLYNGIDLAIHASNTTDTPLIGGISLTNLKYRVRNTGGNNDFGRVTAANVTVSDASVECLGPTRSATETWTNKRVTPRAFQTATASTTVINFDNSDVHIVTAQATGLTISVGGTPTSGQPMILRLKDNGVSQALTWVSNYRGLAVALPANTTAGKEMYFQFRYNSAAAKIDLLALYIGL